jgi:alpha-galactosidase
MKATIIGAGSVEFTRNILADLLSFPELAGMTVALHDIDAERLATAERMALYTNTATGAGATIEAFLERRPALEGADYAINEIQVGGREALLVDFAIPKRHGLRQTIADTLGIGGVIRGLRTLPVMIAIGNDMAEVCPSAWLLNYTNPMAMVPWAVYAGSPFSRVVGLCHSVRDTHEFLAECVGVPKDEVAFQTAGLNHQAFVLRFERDGEDLYPLLDEAIEHDPDGLGRRVRVELYRRLGYFPTESSEHSSEYVPWFLHSDEMIERFRIPVDDYVGRTAETLAEHRAIEDRLATGDAIEIEPTSELASEVIHAVETGVPRQVYANVRNGGLLDGYPSESTVEVPCLVDKAGVQPTRIGAMPPQLRALNRTYLNVAELTVRAVIEGDRRLAYHAAMLDPNAAASITLDEIHDVVDELIDAHGELIPEAIRRGARRGRSRAMP